MAKKNQKQDRLFENLLRVTYEYVKGRHYSPQTKETLVQRLKIHPEHIAIFEGVLENLHESGKVRQAGDKILPHDETKEKQADVIQGKLTVHPRGFGFVESPNPNEADIFIPKPFMNDAIDSDIVEVLINRETVSEKGPEGKILSIITRKRSQLVGTIWSIRSGEAFAFCQVLGEKHLVKVKQPNTKKKNSLNPLVIGDRVVLDVVEWGKKPEPTITTLSKRIGHISDPSTDIQASILEHGIRTEFPQEAIDEACTFGTKVTKQDLIGREDLRSFECFTIDPDTAKDYDDALSLEKTDSGYLLGVHIADVSHYVKANSALDTEAQNRCNSTYFPGKCIPMLPSQLSDHLCSLHQGVLRLTVSVFADIDEEGNTKQWRICRSVIKSQKRFTYKDVKKILDEKKKSKHTPTLKRMMHLCNLLKAKRAERGSVQLYMPELIVKVDAHGMPQDTELVEYDITHQMVEEFMLKANEIVAIELTKQGKNAGFRVHEEPSKESLREFSSLAKAFGFSLAADPSPQDIQKMFAEMEVTATSQYLATCYIRSMRLACYSPDNIGHYGLSLEHYCHFTSPIRRYVDTIIHRLLFENNVEKDVVTKLCKQASEKERLSAKAEGSVIQMKKLRLLDMLATKHKYRQFEAVVTRIKPFGIYFDILELMLEGFLHISELDDDFFDYVEHNMRLLGRYQGTSYQSGDRLHVMVRHIDLIQRECSWQLITHSDFEPLSLEKAKKPRFDKEIDDFVKRKQTKKIKKRK